MIGILALRNLVHRPRRSLFLLLGYGLGVGVMIVLLAIGEALLTQARDEKLVGGGEITVLPEGLDAEVMKTGGVGGLFFSIDRARFVYRQLLAAPRLSRDIDAVAPQIDGKLLYLRAVKPGGGGRARELYVRASAEIPSRSLAVGAAAPLAAGRWEDDDGDRRWIAPTPVELYGEIDRFHMPPEQVRDRRSWGEWHYFNVLSAGGRHWAFISLMVAGNVRGGGARDEWGGEVAITLREQGGRTRRFATRVASDSVRFSTEHPDLTLGQSSVRLLADGRYVVSASAPAALAGQAGATVELTLTPAPRAYFPGAELAECRRGSEDCSFVSGYAVPALRAEASGRICAGGACERFDAAQAYHDHNWGVWRGVSWEWGATRAGGFTILYGRVNPPESAEREATSAAAPPLFVYVVDSLGFRAIFRPREILYTGSREILVDGRRVKAPASALIADARGQDTLRLELTIDDAIGTDMRRSFLERGDPGGARNLRAPFFIQMKGSARLTGRAGGAPMAGVGSGFFETFR